MMNQPESQRNDELDMSPEAYDRRLRNVSQLYKLGMAIRAARSKPVSTTDASGDGDTNPQSASQVD